MSVLPVGRPRRAEGLHRPRALAVLVAGGLALASATAPAPPAAGQAAIDPASIDISEGCLSAQCHRALVLRPTVHTVVEMEQCEPCHVPVDEKHEFEPVEDPPDLCLQCHDPFPTDQKMHGIVEAGECLSCHDPHGSGGRYLLIEDSVVAVCAQCHDDPSKEFPYPHGPARDGECIKCHNPHYAKNAKLLDLKDSDLCLKCHSESIRRLDKTFTRNIGDAIEHSEYVHGAVWECTSCHGPHGGISRPSLAHQFPATPYAPFSEEAYELCFQCHDAAVFTEEASNDTGFRDGQRNLHYLHVNKTKGRRCTFCHDPHATNWPFMLKDNVRFGTWQFSLRYEQTPTGGGCWPGCHRKLTYDREKPAQAALRTLVPTHAPRV